MAVSIRLFSFNRKYFDAIGIYLLQTNGTGPSFNSKNRVLLISFVLLALPSGAFFIFDAKSMLEYGISFFGASATLFMMSVYLMMIAQMENVRLFLESCERFMGNSKL